MTKIDVNAEANPRTPVVISGTVDARELTARLKLLARHTPKAWVLPILNCCELTFDDTGTYLKLSQTTCDRVISTRVKGEGSGSVFVPLATLTSFMKAATGETVFIDKGAKDQKVIFHCGDNILKVGPIVGDAPELREPAVYDRGINLGEGELLRLISMTEPFVSTEETRYYLNGIAFKIGDGTLRAVATDGHKLGTRLMRTAAPVEASPHMHIVPNDVIPAVREMIGAGECLARFHMEKTGKVSNIGNINTYNGFVSFSGSGWHIKGKLIDGTYPDYQRVVPNLSDNDTIFTCDAADIIRLAKMTRSNGRGERPVVITTTDENSLSLSYKRFDDDAEFTGVARAECNHVVPGKIAVNLRYLASIAKTLGGGKIELSSVDRDGFTSPILLKSPGDESSYAILMPMRS